MYLTLFLPCFCIGYMTITSHACYGVEFDDGSCPLAPPSSPVEKPRTISATSTLLEHCKPFKFSSGRECQ